MLSHFFLDRDAYTFSFLRVANVLVFDLDRIDRLGEVGVFSLNANNVSNVELATCEFDDAHTKMGIVVGYTTEQFFFRLRAHGWIPHRHRTIEPNLIYATTRVLPTSSLALSRAFVSASSRVEPWPRASVAPGSTLSTVQ